VLNKKMRTFGLPKKRFLRRIRVNTCKLVLFLAFVNWLNYFLRNDSIEITISVFIICLLFLFYTFFQSDIFQIHISESNPMIKILKTNGFGKTEEINLKSYDIHNVTLKKEVIKRGKVDLKLKIKTDKNEYQLVSGWNSFDDRQLNEINDLIENIITRHNN
jgi:hypothetical protein